MTAQNIYDNQNFFDGYKKLRENSNSANNIVEKSALFSLSPDLVGKRVLDLGCGYGENCVQFLRMGAKSVVGIDISERMLAVAREETSGVEYIHADMSDLSGLTGRFDVVFSSFAVHYIENFERLCVQVAGLLNNKGYFVFSQEHPLTTAYMGGERWTKDENGNRIHYNLSHYTQTGLRETTWIIDGVQKFHRTFSDILNALVCGGFAIEKVIELMPDNETLARLPQYASYLHKPDCLLIRARKI